MNTENKKETTYNPSRWAPTSGDRMKANRSNRAVEGRANARFNSSEVSPREQQLNHEREARKEATLRRIRNKQIKKIKKYIKLGITCACVGIFLAVFVFKTPIERGTKELESGKYQEAIEEFSKGLKDIDYIAESYKGIGIAYYELGQYKDAAENLENAVQRGQTILGTTYYLLAVSYMKIGDYSNALKNVTTALTKSGNSPELIQELKYHEVLCMEYTSDWEGAKAKATSYLQSYPNDEAMKAEYDFLASR